VHWQSDALVGGTWLVYLGLFSMLWIHIGVSAWIRLEFDRLEPDPEGQKWANKIERKVKKFHILKCWIFYYED
jgi:hypothetical protein